MKGKKEKRRGREREIWMDGCMGGCMDGCMDKLIPGRQKKMIFLLNIEFYWILADKKKKKKTVSTSALLWLAQKERWRIYI